MSSMDELKRATGYRAVDFVQSGMIVGLGSGSTARYATLCIAEKLRSGALRDIVAIPTSEDTARLARAEGIPLTAHEEQFHIDVTIDGADEVDPHLDVIKGLGGCLLREKIVAFATAHEIIVVDHSKLVQRLGTKNPVPVEVIRLGWRNTEAALARTGARTKLREVGGAPFVTDEGNYIIDCTYPDGIAAPDEIERALNMIPGVVENGLFLGITQTVVIASPSGVSIRER
jgi:ribose 5-phosphate isomerase A